MGKDEELARVRHGIEDCEKCELWLTRKNTVPGEGSNQPKIMFIGEAPGANEDIQGRPFVGRAGKLLEELLDVIGLKREEVFIGNVLKCRPPDNRDPEPSEINACTPFLDRQLSVMKPKVIATLGNFATSYILNKYGLGAENIGKIHGEVFPVNNLMISTKIVPLYHPAAALRNPNLRAVLIEDFRTLKELL